MNILVTGSSGQLGQELLARLKDHGEVTLVDRAKPPSGSGTIEQDLADLNQVEILLNRVQPDLIVNAAAYTAVDRAESETEAAFRLNAELPGCLARWAARNDRALVHFSTDYVFDGAGRFRDASDPKPVDEVDNRTLVLFDQGDQVSVEAGDEGIRFLLVSGEPLREPVAWRGPIVMNTQEELQQAYRELREGTFIKDR